MKGSEETHCVAADLKALDTLSTVQYSIFPNLKKISYIFGVLTGRWQHVAAATALNWTGNTHHSLHHEQHGP